MSEEVTEAVARAIEAAGREWINARDETYGWADIPDEVFAKAAIDELRRLNLLSDGERVGK